MPITPHFDLSQTATHICLHISVPHVRVSPESIQVVLDHHENVLHFSSSPYLLLLDFGPSCCFDPAAAESCAKYEPTIKHGTIVLELLKATPGVEWPHLDLLGRLAPLRKANSRKGPWLQSSLPPDAPTGADNEESFDNDDVATPGYGFLGMFRGIYADLARDGLAREMLELPWDDDDVHESGSRLCLVKPATEIRKDRRRRRYEMENTKFCAERFVGDLDIEQDYIYQCAMAMKPHWQVDDNETDSLTLQLSALTVTEETTGLSDYFTKKERAQLMSIPYPLLPSTITSEQQDALLLGLLDILFAYIYDHLMTDGEATVESAWTISVLSASLSCLEDWLQEPQDDEDSAVAAVVQSSMRRALIYPYLRNWEYGRHVWQQVAALLQRGLRPILRSLLQVRAILDCSELYYMGNKLYVDPYLAWLQADPKTVQEKLGSLARSVQDVLRRSTLKNDLGLGLLQLEESLLEETSDSETDDDDESDDSSYASSSDSSSGAQSDQSGLTSSNEFKASPCGVENKQSCAKKQTSSALLDENLRSSVNLESLLQAASLESRDHEEKNCRTLVQELND